MDPDARAREDRRERLAKIRQLNAAASGQAGPGASLQGTMNAPSTPAVASPPLSTSLVHNLSSSSVVQEEYVSRLQLVYEAFRTRNALINESYVALQLEIHTEKLSRDHRKQLTTLTFQLKVTKPLEIKNILHRLTEQREKNRQLEVELESLHRAQSSAANGESSQNKRLDDSLARQLEDVLQQLESSNHEISVLQNELREERLNAHRFEERCVKAEQGVKLLEAANAELFRQSEERAAHVDSSRLVSEQSTTIAQLTNKVESLQKQLRIAEQTQVTASIEAQNKLHDEEVRRQQLVNALEASQRDVKVADAKCAEVQSRYNALDARYGALAESKRDLDQAHGQLARKLDDLASKEATESQLLGSTQARRLELSEALAQMTEDLERERSSCKIISAELFSLKESLKWCEDSNTDLHSKLVASEERCRATAKALHAERSRVAQLESETRDAQDLLSADASHHQTALKKNLVQKASLQNEVAALNTKLLEALSDVRALQEQVAHNTDHYKSRETEQKLQLEIAEQQLSIARKESSSLQDMLREQQKQYAQERSELLSQSQRDAKEYAASLLRHDTELKELLAKQQERFEAKGQQLVEVTKALDAAQLAIQRNELEFAKAQRDKEAELVLAKLANDDLAAQRAQLMARVGELEGIQRSLEATRTRSIAETGTIASESLGKVAEISAKCRTLEGDIELLRGEVAHKEQLVQEKLHAIDQERSDHAITRKLHIEDLARLRAELADDMQAERGLRAKTEDQLKVSEGLLRDALMKNSDLVLDMQRIAHETDIRQKDLAETQRLLDSSRALIKSQVTQISELIERSDGVVLSMNEDISALKLELATKSVEISKLRELSKNRADRLVDHLQQEVEEVKSALEVQEQHHAQELERYKMSASAREHDLHATIDALKDRVSQLSQQLTQKSEQNRALQDALQRCESELGEMALQIDTAEATATRERQNSDALEVDLERLNRREQELLDKIDSKDRQLREAAAAHKALDFDFQHLVEQLTTQQQEHAAAADALQLKLEHAQSLFGSRLTTAVESSHRRVTASFELFRDFIDDLEQLSRHSVEDSRSAFDTAVRHALHVAHYFVHNVARFKEVETQLATQVGELGKQKKSIRLVSSQITSSLLLQIEYADTHGELSFNQTSHQRQEMLHYHKALCQRAAFLDSELAASQARRSAAEFELLKVQEVLTITQQQLLHAEMELVELKRDGNSLAALAKDTAQRSSEAERSLRRVTDEAVYFRQAAPALAQAALGSVIDLEQGARGIHLSTFTGFISDAHAVFSRLLDFVCSEQMHHRSQADQLRTSAHQAIQEHSSAAQFERDRCAREVYTLRSVNQLQSAILVESRDRSLIENAAHDALSLQLLPSWFSELIHLLKYGHTLDTQRVLHALHVSQKETQLLRSKTSFLADLEVSGFRSSVERLNRRREQDRRFLQGTLTLGVAGSAALSQSASAALDAVDDLEQASRAILAKMGLDALHGIYVFTLQRRNRSPCSQH